MLCPNCKTENLVTSENHNVQIDHCPRCRGVWLDRGELEKLIQMSSGDDRQDEGVNGRQYGEDEEEAPRKRGYTEDHEEDDDDSRESERGGSYQGRDKDDDSGNERGDTYRSRERGDNPGGDDRTGTYRSRERYDDQRGNRTEQEGGRSIWREIFENLGDKLPFPRN